MSPLSFWIGFPGFAVPRRPYVLGQLTEPTGSLRGCLEGFRDLVIADGSVIRLHALLENALPACRTNHTKAAAKLHVVLSVLGCGPKTVKITSERTGEREALSIGPWVKDRLLLVDLAYYRFQLFDGIRRNGGFFISRLKTTANL